MAETKPELIEIGKTIRESLNMCVDAAELETGVSGTCALACVLLETTISKWTGMPVVVRGGAGERNEGILCLDNVWRGHYWVEVETESGPMVLDITADQFGMEPLVLIPLAEASRYRAGDQEEVDEQILWTRQWMENAGATSE